MLHDKIKEAIKNLNDGHGMDLSLKKAGLRPKLSTEYEKEFDDFKAAKTEYLRKLHQKTRFAPFKTYCLPDK